MRHGTFTKLDAAFDKVSKNFSCVSLDVPLNAYSTLRVGGPARLFAEPGTVRELIDIFDFAQRKELPLWILGAGSSVIPHDRGFDGLIICTRKVEPDPKRLSTDVIEVSCGTFMPVLARFCRKLELSGLEWSIGIPGTMGGGIWMNAGAWGGETAKVIEDISFWNGSQIEVVRRDEVHWSYRHSSFQDHPERLILSARLRLEASTRAQIDLRMKECIEGIRSTQPRRWPNVGTVFKANRQALPALGAGQRIGGMVCSLENPGWILNIQEGTASDAYRLICLILWRHLWRGLPMPKIEPVFLPYDLREGSSYASRLNHPPLGAKLFARVSCHWSFLFKRHLTSWRPQVEQRSTFSK